MKGVSFSLRANDSHLKAGSPRSLVLAEGWPFKRVKGDGVAAPFFFFLAPLVSNLATAGPEAECRAGVSL